MTGIAVVASAHDANFAEEVRAGLQAAGLDAFVSQSLPKAAGPRVVLIWSATLEAVHAIDAQALIGLWSEDRLVTVRRDETPLPLGLRDLPSLSPSSTAEEVCAAVPHARYTTAGPPAEVEQVLVGSMAGAATTGTGPTGSQDVEFEFWRAIKDGNDPDDFELYVQQFPTGIYAALAKRKIAKLRGIAPEDTGAKAKEQERKEAEEAAKREAEVKQKLAEEKAKLEALLAAKAEVGRPEADRKKKLAEPPKEKKSIGVVIGALVAIVIVSGGGWYYFNKSSLEKRAALTVALENATKATQELRQAHVRELEALKALEQARAAEDAARKAGDPEKLKEAQEDAKRAEAEAAKQAEAVKQREAAAADARKKAQDGATAAKSAKAEPKQEVPPVQPKQEAAAPKQETAPKQEAKAETKATEPVAKAEPPKAKTRSQREREEEDRLARQAVLKKGVPVAAAPATTAAAEAQATSAPEHDALHQQAMAMEQDGNAKDAIRIYRRAARAGSGKAAKRLGEIYDRGVPGVSRDYAESLQWYETARRLGETVETAGRGGSGPAAAPSPPRPAPEVTAKSAPAPKLEEPVAAIEPRMEPTPAPPPAPVPTAEPPKAAPPSPAPPPESKSGWFSMRGLLIALFVLALIAWRRHRRREKAAARQAQRASAAAVDHKEATTMAAARSVYRSGEAAGQAAPSDSMLFVSYSHKDRPLVEPIVSVIEDMGRRVWMDRSDITGQTGWAGQIVRAIRECRAVVLMASPNSYTSDQVVRELYLAMNHKKTIVPIEIEPAEMPDELQYILAPFQHHRLSGRETREVIGRALAAV